MIDCYLHNNTDIMYITENILGPSEQSQEGEELIKDFNSQLTYNCECIDKCVSDSCKCLKVSGGANYTLSQKGTKLELYILNRKKYLDSYPIIECNKFCKCSEHCGNRLVQNGPINTLFVKLTENKLKGLGLFTNTLILKGSFICEYAGEVLSRSQALLRHNYNEMHGKMNYIFCLNEHVGGRIAQTYIDPSSFGNIGRYINHSCNPNCEIIPVRFDSPIVRLAVFSILDITPDTEITFSYGSDDVNDTISDVVTRKLCLCNSSKCKGFMPSLPF